MSVAVLDSEALFPLQGEISDRGGGESGERRLDVENLPRRLGGGGGKEAHRAARHGHLDRALYLMRGGFADAAPVGDSALATALQRLHNSGAAGRRETAKLMAGSRPIAASPPCIYGLPEGGRMTAGNIIGT